MSRMRSRVRFPVTSIAELARKNPRLAELFPQSAPVPLPEWKPFEACSLSTMQKAALLMMTVSQVKNALIGRLLEDAQDRPTGPDFASLRDLNLAEWKDGKRMHQLTGPGRTAAIALEQACCREFGIHFLISSDARTEMQEHRCTCGEFRVSLKRGLGTGSWANLAFARHVESVKGVEAIYGAMKPAAFSSAN